MIAYLTSFVPVELRKLVEQKKEKDEWKRVLFIIGNTVVKQVF